MIRLLAALLPFLLFAEPAAAGPVAGAVMAIGSISIGGVSVGSIMGNMLASVALSALSRALRGKPAAPQNGGLRTQSTIAGGTTPQTIIVGRYATGGCLIAPPYTHGIKGDGDQVEHLVILYNLADHPIDGVESVIIDGESCVFDVPSGRDGGIYGNTCSTYNDRAFLRWHDGQQAAADEMLAEVYGSHPDRPWQSSAILTRTSYGVLTYKYDPEIWTGIPQARFVLRGARLYDPRLDSSVGGSGSQRWNDPSTWSWTENPVVIIYNILRGIELYQDPATWSPVTYGLRVPAEKLPLSNWTTAMNACDEEVAVAGGGTRPRYRAGLEFGVSDEPLSVIEIIADACCAELAQVGGIWRIQIGAPAAVSAYLTDDDLMLDGQDNLNPFARLGDLYNAAHASFPHPDRLWESAEATPYYRPDLEEVDGGRRLVADLNLAAVSDPRQIRALMREFVKDARRGTIATITVPPALLYLRPLQTISWSSARHGFVNELFEIRAKTIDPMTLCSTLTLRARSVLDYDEDADGDAQQPADPSTGSSDPIREGVPGFGVEGIITADDAAAVRLEWNPEIVGGEIRYQVRVQATGQVVADGRAAIEDAQIVISGVLPNTEYEVRARVIGGRKSTWGDWIAVTTPDASGGSGGTGMIDDRLEAEDGDLTLAAASSSDTVVLAGGETAFANVGSTGITFTADISNPRIVATTGEIDLRAADGSYVRLRSGSTSLAWVGTDSSFRAQTGEVDIRAGSGSQVRFRHGSVTIATVTATGLAFATGVSSPIISSASLDITLAAAGPARSVFLAGGSTTFAVASSSAIRPGTDNSQSAGSASYRYSQVYAATATINTSDAREKTDTGPIADAILDAWAQVQWRSFRFSDAVAAKGAAARTHIGVVAQQIQAAFEAAELDPFALGILCHDTWQVEDEEGNPTEETRDRYGVRYEEALALEAALLRRTQERLEARLAALEAAVS